MQIIKLVCFLSSIFLTACAFDENESYWIQDTKKPTNDQVVFSSGHQFLDLRIDLEDKVSFFGHSGEHIVQCHDDNYNCILIEGFPLLVPKNLSEFPKHEYIKIENLGTVIVHHKNQPVSANLVLADANGMRSVVYFNDIDGLLAFYFLDEKKVTFPELGNNYFSATHKRLF